MTFVKSTVTGLALVLALGASGAMAASAAKVAKVHSPESIACSQQADAKGLHGKDRASFRKTCKAQMRASNTTAAKKPAPAVTDKKS